MDLSGVSYSVLKPMTEAEFRKMQQERIDRGESPVVTKKVNLVNDKTREQLLDVLHGKQAELKTKRLSKKE